MAIYPPDDPGLSAATRRRLRPLINGYSSRFIDNVKRNAPTAGSSQSRDMWGGRTKFIADCPFVLKIDDIELLMSFWNQYRTIGFTFFDFESKTIGAPGYMPADALGTGDGTTTTFTARVKEITPSTLIAYSNGVIVPGATISTGTGAQGEDRIVYPTAPAAAAVLTIAYKGRRRYTVEIPAPPVKSTADWNTQRLSMTVLEKF